MENGKEVGVPAPAKQMEQIIQKEIKFLLKPEEKNKMADEAASLSREHKVLSAEFAESSKATREVLKGKQQEISRLLECHINGIEVRAVKVTERLDWEKGTVEYLLNNEIVESRKMNDDEKQMRLSDNPTRKIKKVKKPTKAEKNPDLNLTPEELKAKDLADVHKLETGRKTKRSSVDKSL